MSAGMGAGRADPALLDAMMNLSEFHQEHERFYSTSPLETAVRLHRYAHTLQSLADRWLTASPSTSRALSPYEGAEDLNSPAAIALDGVLFLEGGNRPAELTAMIGQLRADADGFGAGGEWLATAMEASWAMAATLLDVDELADVMGERHRIISNDWLASHMQTLISQLLTRAAEMLERVDFTPHALRADLAAARVAPRRLHAAAEVVSRAADLCCESAELVHDNGRRWRTFRTAVADVQRTLTAVGAEALDPRR